MSEKFSLEFTETMDGHVEFDSSQTKWPLDRSDYSNAQEKNIQELSFKLTILVDDMEKFQNDENLLANAIGTVYCDKLGGELKVITGKFNLFVKPESSTNSNAAKEMHYTLFFNDKDGNPYTFYGFKVVEKEDWSDVWNETTTLYTSLWKGHSDYSENRPDLVAIGILRLTLMDFMNQLKTFKMSGGDIIDKTKTLTDFMGVFAGKLWESYAPTVFGTDSFRWNEHIYPVNTTEGVKGCTTELIPINTKDGLTISLQRFKKSESKDVVLLLHGLTTSTDMYIMPETYNLTSYLHDHGLTDVWSLDWRGSGRFTYNLIPNRYTVDHVAKYDIPAAIDHLKQNLPEGTNIHVICHCVGSIGLLSSVAAGYTKGLKSIISNSVSLTPKIPFMSKLKLFFAPAIIEYIFGYPYLSPKMPYMPGPGFGKWIHYMEKLLRKECNEPACHMVSFMWGWGFPAAYLHKNLSPVTHRRLVDLFGGVGVHWYRHLRKMAYKNEALPYKKEDEFFEGPSSYLNNLSEVKLPPTLLFSGDKNLIFPGSNKLCTQVINEKFPDQPVQYMEFPEYGHQDVFMGENCYNDIFPSLVKFIKENSD